MKKLVSLVMIFTSSFLFVGCDPVDPPEMFTVSVTSIGNGDRGSIDPIINTVEKGKDATFKVIPKDEKYYKVYFSVDGVELKESSKNVYVVKNVLSNHKVSISFQPIERGGIYIILGRNGTISSSEQIDDEDFIPSYGGLLYIGTEVGKSITFVVKPSDGFIVDTFMVGGVMKTLSSDNTYITGPVNKNMDKIYITFKMDIKYGSPEWILIQNRWNCDSIFIYDKNETYPEGVWHHYPYNGIWIFTFFQTGFVIEDWTDISKDENFFYRAWYYRNNTLDVAGWVLEVKELTSNSMIIGKKNDFYYIFTNIK